MSETRPAPAATPVRPRALLVLGMHRSGTSAFTRVCNLLGAELGSELLAPQPDNPSGFWEHRELNRLHDEALAALDREWWDVRPAACDPDAQALRGTREAMTAVVRSEFAKTPLWAVKDPRICRLLPLWRAVLDDVGARGHAVLVVRDPAGVISSLCRRDDFSSETAGLLWLLHVVEAERETRGMPRTVVHFESLREDWLRVMRDVEADLDITWPVPADRAREEVEAFLGKAPVTDSSLTPGTAVRAPLSRWLQQAHDRLQHEPLESASLREVFDDLWSQLCVLDGMMGSLVADVRERSREAIDRALAAARPQREALRDSLEHAEAELQQIRTEREALRDSLASSEAELQRMRIEREALHDSLERTEAELQQVRTEREALRDTVVRAEAELQRMQTEFEELQASRAYRLALAASAHARDLQSHLMRTFGRRRGR